MKNKMPNAALVWKQLDDFLVPRLAMNVLDRAEYSHLLRHSRLEGKSRFSFSIAWLARGVRISEGAARPSVRRLLVGGALRLFRRSKAGHVMQVLLPGEILGRSRLAGRPPLPRHGSSLNSRNIGQLNFFRTSHLRKAIHAREGGFCFYCRRRITSSVQCLDHVVPQVRSGANSYPSAIPAKGRRQPLTSCVGFIASAA